MGDPAQGDTIFVLRGKLTWNDILRFQFFSFFRSTWWIVAPVLLFALGVSVFAVGAALWFRSYEIFSKGIPVYVVTLGWTALLLNCPYMIGRKQWKTSISMQDEYVHTFSSENIQFASAHSSGQVSWKTLWNVRETKTMYCLYFSEISAGVLPKRFFKNADEQSEWRRFVEQQIQKTIAKPGVIGARF